MGLEKGQKVLIVDDVLTTGRSVVEVIDLVMRYGAEIVGIGILLDRSNGTAKFDYPFYSLATVASQIWEPEKCPLCLEKVPLTQRGSRVY